MTSAHWHVLLVYFSVILIATLLALAQRWIKPEGGGESVWRKYPTYILINLCFLAASWLPPTWHILMIVLALLGAVASWEIARVLLQTQQTSFSIIALSGATLALIIAADFLDIPTWFTVWLTTLLLFIALNTLSGEPADYSRRALALAGSVIYLPICLAAYLWIQDSDPSGFRVTFLYLIVAANDALAQITGQLFGTRQLSPRISPAKTIEGAVGGVLFACVMGIALSNATGFSYFTGAFFGVILGLAAVVGDLTASIWKRTLGIRNFSTLLGAQGGVLDRFDGLIFAAPVFYLLISRV